MKDNGSYECELITIPITFPHDLLVMLLWLANEHRININDEILMRLGESIVEEDTELNPHMVWEH